ncbi:MAG: LytTR family transcriptional regulator [Bacteroidales bacterium]|jgi:DNA-binding LytR/AlgR family response regulator|nr:LytTR family transcriptional regulator [Bacteroidales bacterium]
MDIVTVKTGTNIDVIYLDDIFFLQASGDYVEIHTNDRTFLKEQTMKYFEENLPDKKFVRVHRSYIVNLRKIVRMEKYGRQSVILTLSNREKLKVSTEGYRLLKKRMGI